jgi:polysaccharide deacetylase 2 family uncharacterized protein YibQ
MLLPVAGLLALLTWGFFHGASTPDETLRTALGGSPSSRFHEESALPRVTAKKQEDAKPARHRGDIVVIIDDLGFEGQPIERVMAIDPNLNASILPNGTNAAETAARFNARGFEVLCHLPMEPQGNASPGANAILTSMSDDEIARATRANIGAVPFARGVNNHMGSRATADRRVMESVLGALPKNMYFIDSRTSGRSIAFDLAREMKIRSAARQVFLDDVQSEAAVRRQLANLAEAAEQRGVAIGIGHPHAVTLRVLAAEIPNLRSKGFRFLRASEVVR